MIPEADQKKFGLVTPEEVREIRKTEREKIHHVLCEIIRKDQLTSERENAVLDGLKRMFGNVTEVNTSTTNVADVVQVPIPALDIEGDIM